MPGRRLRRAADAEQDHVRLLQILRQVAVVVGEGEVHRVDALEVLGVQHVLGARPGRLLRAEVGLQKVVDRLQHREAGRTRFPRRHLEPLAEIAPHQGVEHEARRRPDLRDHPFELGGRAHQRVDVLDGRDAFVLRRRRPADIDERLARGIGDEMEMKVAAAHARRLRPVPVIQRRGAGESTSVDRQPCRAGPVPRRGRLSTPGCTGRQIGADSSRESGKPGRHGADPAHRPGQGLEREPSSIIFAQIL